MSDRQYPAHIPRDRAVAALDLAHLVLDYEEDLETGEPDGEVEVSAHVWSRMLARARAAAEAK